MPSSTRSDPENNNGFVELPKPRGFVPGMRVRVTSGPELLPVYQVPVFVEAEVEIRLGCEIEEGLAIDQNGPCVPGRCVRRDHVGFIGRIGAGRNDPQVGVGDDEDISRLHVVVLQHQDGARAL